MPAPTLAARLAEYAAGLTFEKLTKEAVHETKRRFIDSFATAIGAMPSDAYAVAKKCAARVSSNPGASILAGGKSSVEWATFVNGLLIRYLDFNDTYLSKEPAHPSDNLAAVLADLRDGTPATATPDAIRAGWAAPDTVIPERAVEVSG